MGDTLGYARVSTHDQNPDAQRDRLIEAGAIRVFTDIVSGKRFDRPALAKLIDHARPGDRLCIIRLDRLGRSLRELLETVDDLKTRGIHLLQSGVPLITIKDILGHVDVKSTEVYVHLNLEMKRHALVQAGTPTLVSPKRPRLPKALLGWLEAL